MVQDIKWLDRTNENGPDASGPQCHRRRDPQAAPEA